VTLDIFLALGLLLSMASQLRVAELPIGPGEICLVIWLLVMLGREVVRFGPPKSPAFNTFVCFWVVFVLAESVGTLAAVFTGVNHDTGLFLHDIAAYTLLIPISCLVVVEPGAALRSHRIAWLTVILGSLLLLGQLANAFLFAVPVVTPWYWDRLRGWSENPNQLALVCLVLTLLPLHLVDVTKQPRVAFGAMACAALALGVGILSKSDTYRVAMVAIIPVFTVLKFRLWIKTSQREWTFRVGAAQVAAVGVPLLLVSAIPLAAFVSIRPSDFSKDGSREAAHEADLRLNAWKEAIDRGMQSGLLGLGPGPHLTIPASILEGHMSTSVGEPSGLDHPEAGEAPNFEAHNTILDLFTQGGLLADAVFIWLVSKALIATYRAKRAGLTVLICGLIVFTTTHLIVRLPIFWFSVALCLVAGTKPSESVVKNWS
jgi:hypothetical protein